MKKKSIVLLLTLSLLSSSVVYAGENESNAISSEVEQFADEQTNVEETTEELETQESQQILEQQEQSLQDVSNQENEEESQKSEEEPKPIEKHYGWFRESEDSPWFYYDQKGNMYYGWLKYKNKWYYLNDKDNQESPGAMLSDCKSIIDSKTYFFDKEGRMLTGWVKRPEGWYYTDKSGAMKTGWIKDGGKWYYLNEKNEENPGVMYEDVTVEIGGKTYTFLSSGAMKAGWSWENKGWYYYDTYTGQIVSGWKKIGSKWYYLDPQNGNKMIANTWGKISGKWYRFNSNGVMVTGWSKINSRWYYFSANGAACTRWKAIGGKWYYFYKAGDKHGGVECAMAVNVKIDGWKLSASGAMVSTAESKMSAKAQMYKSNSKYLILVDRSACRVGIFTGKAGAWKEKYYWACSPGKPSTPTVSGVFKVGIKGRYFDSGSARCHWYTQFKGNYLFHSVLYTKSGKISDGRLGMKLSHGCVRLNIKNAKWIYDNIPKGTTVVVY